VNNFYEKPLSKSENCSRVVVGAPADHIFAFLPLAVEGAEAVGKGADGDTPGAGAPRR
jgi:hypothetical protein